MPRSFLLARAALTAAFAIGCADQQSPTAADQAAPSFGAQHLPAFTGLLLGGDPSNPLAIRAGYEPGRTAADVCADPSQGIETEAQNGKDVFTPHGGFHEQIHARDVSLVLYAFGAGPVTDPCQLVGAPVLGTGTGDFTWNINVGKPGGVFVVHVTVHGTIDLVGGGQARVLGTARVQVRPDGTVHFDDERVKLK